MHLLFEFAKLKNYKESFNLFKQYFEYKFSHQIYIKLIFYPFVKYYHSAMHLDNPIEMSSFDELVKRLIKVYQQKLGDDYDLKVEEAYQAYLSLLESDDLIDKETYEIFAKFFLVDQMKGI